MSAFWEGVGPQRWPVNPAALHLPVEPLAQLRELWAKRPQDGWTNDVINLVAEVFDDLDGELHALAGLPPYREPKQPPTDLVRAFNDPTVDCCGRDAADCDCDPVYVAIADSLRGSHPNITVDHVARVDRQRHTARPILNAPDLAIEAALKAYDKEIRRG